jgi:hypothetical protein
MVRSREMTARRLVVASYRLLDSGFRDWPLLDSRTYSVGFYLLIFWPLLFISLTWVLTNILTLISRVRLLVENVELPYDSDVVPQHVGVRVAERHDELPFARPVTFPFFRDWIVISRSLLEKLDRSELDAVLAHEVYHIHNRDPVVNTLSSVVSIGFGGMNTLLAFYDYPQIERDADDYASRRVGTEPLVRAIDKIETLHRRADGRAPPWGQPGFVETDSFEWSADTTIPNYALSLLVECAVAPYDLLFGRAVLDTAHLSPRERIERLRDSERN